MTKSNSNLNSNNFNVKAADWRAAIKKNRQRTFFIITVFLAIYVFLGILVDIFIYAGEYPTASFSDLFLAIIHLQLFPYATLVMFGVALISLLVTISMANKLMLLGTEYTEVTPTTAKTENEKQLYNIVEELKIASGLTYIPKVYVIEANYLNAFASGFSEKSAMVAITRGLLDKLNRAELEAVMAHEMSHIRHLDIKVTLMASVLANLMLMVLDIFFYSALYSNDRESNTRNTLAPFIILLRYLLPLINILLLLYLSRTREYMADAGCVELMRDNQPLASALLKIENDSKENAEQYRLEYGNTPHENVRRAAYIFDPVQAGLEPSSSIADIFSTHPNIFKRLQALGFYPKKP